jgi:signal peptidase II
MIRFASPLLVASAILALDQFSKYLILLNITSGEKIALLPFLNLTLTFNSGVAFGLFAGSGDLGRWLLLTLAVVVSLGLLIWWWRLPMAFSLRRHALLLVVAGAVGNALDRLFYGHVVDFIDFHFFGWHYPAFNIADSAITLGALTLLFSLWRQDVIAMKTKKEQL